MKISCSSLSFVLLTSLVGSVAFVPASMAQNMTMTNTTDMDGDDHDHEHEHDDHDEEHSLFANQTMTGSFYAVYTSNSAPAECTTSSGGFALAPGSKVPDSCCAALTPQPPIFPTISTESCFAFNAQATAYNGCVEIELEEEHDDDHHDDNNMTMTSPTTSNSTNTTMTASMRAGHGATNGTDMDDHDHDEHGHEMHKMVASYGEMCSPTMMGNFNGTVEECNCGFVIIADHGSGCYKANDFPDDPQGRQFFVYLDNEQCEMMKDDHGKDGDDHDHEEIDCHCDPTSTPGEFEVHCTDVEHESICACFAEQATDIAVASTRAGHTGMDDTGAVVMCAGVGLADPVKDVCHCHDADVHCNDEKDEVHCICMSDGLLMCEPEDDHHGDGGDHDCHCDGPGIVHCDDPADEGTVCNCNDDGTLVCTDDGAGGSPSPSPSSANSWLKVPTSLSLLLSLACIVWRA